MEISSSASSSVPSTPIQQEDQSQRDKEAAILTPRTRILSMANEYCMVIMVDLSSSLATTDANRGNVMIDNIHHALRNVMNDLAQPISIPSTDTPFEPTIRLTVLAECSQFGSNINVIPILAEFPTMRVFLQNVRITPSNVSSILKTLNDSIAIFLRDLAAFRQKLKKRRSKLGYELDVRRNHSSMMDHDSMPGSNGDEEIFDTTYLDEAHQETTKRKKHANRESISGKPTAKKTKASKGTQTSSVQKSTTTRQQPQRKDTKKDIWGVGKTGSNLSYILHAGLFALSLLPDTGRRSLILLTDGVVKSNIQDEFILRQLSSDNIACSIIQISSGPSMDCNFGFIPDTDILKFVASATGGQYMHIEDLFDCSASESVPKDTLDRIIASLSVAQRKFLLHEVYMDKSRAGTNATSRTSPWAKSSTSATLEKRDFQLTTTGTGNGFPWDPKAEPEIPEAKLLRYQEYALPNKLAHVIAARTRQGFSLFSFTVDRRRSTQLNVPNGKKPQVIITLALQWQPQITIEYRIRAALSSTTNVLLSSYFGTGTISEDNTPTIAGCSRLLSSLTNAKAEILIRANSTFSHLLRNWDAFQRRFQVMGIFTGSTNSPAPSLSGSAAILKISKLKQLLTAISEADKHLSTILNLDTRSSRRLLSPAAQALQFQELWQKLDDNSDIRHQTSCWYDTHHRFDLVLHFTPHYCYADRSSALINSAEDAVLSTVLDRLHDLLYQNTDFISNRGTFVKITPPTDTDPCCRLFEIRITHEGLRTIHVDIRFFNTPMDVRMQIMDQFMHILSTQIQFDEEEILTELEISSPSQPSNKSQQSLPLIKIAKRPLSSLLMRDPEHYFGNTKDREDYYNRRPSTEILLAGEYIARNYMRRQRWSWDTHIVTTAMNANDFYGLQPLQDLAFERLCHARIKEGYILVSFGENACHFYRESYDRIERSSQYFIWRDPSKRVLTTELWLEPVTRDDQHRQDIVLAEQKRLLHQDRKILTKLVSFDWTFVTGYQQQRGPPSKSDADSPGLVDDDLLGIHHMKKSMMIDISAVLRPSAFSVVVYPCPQQLKIGDEDIISASHDKSVVWLQTERYLPLAKKPEEVHPKGWHSPGVGLIRGSSYNQGSCHCPRPDREFLLFREAFSDLPSLYRDVALTHYYFHQHLRMLADCEMDPTVSSDGFWSAFFDEIASNPDTHAAKSTLRLSRRITDMQCFVKTFNPSTFIVVLAPSLTTLMHNHSQHSLGFLLFECYRQSSPVKDEDDAERHVTFKEIDFSSIKESILSPRLTNGTYHDEDGERPFSDFKSRLLQDISDIYNICYAKSIYSSLLFGSVVSAEDFDKVLDICEEIVLDIDLTGYLNVQTLLRRHGRTNVEEWQSAQQRFNSVLEHYFEPVIYSQKKKQFIYCYRPAHVKIGNKTENGNKLTRLADVVVSAQCPLFIRLEYTLNSPKHAVKRTFPLEVLPTSYDVQDNGQTFSYEPTEIGSTESPVASADGSSATVRLVCMIVPQTKYAPIINAHHVHGCPAESPVHHQSSFFDNEIEYREALSELSAEKQDALIETKARLTWLLTEEVMHGLLRAGPVTDVVVRYIQSHLMKKNPFVDFPTTMVIPLVFVKGRQMGRRTFLEQLERNTMTPYKLVRVGDCFYATDHKEYGDVFDTTENFFYRRDQHEGADFYTDLGIELYTDEKRPPAPQQDGSQNGNDEFCEGLGISIMEPDVFSDEDDPNTVDTQVPQQLYWLLIIPRSQSVQIYFYSKMPQSVNRSEIVRVTKVMINEAIERTNKLVLLQHLYDTRTCSKYLIANDGSTANNSNDTSTEESSDDSDGKHSKLNDTGGLVEMLSTSGEEVSFTPPKKFRPGQFKCDVIYTWRFPLHWRLQPNIALNALSSDVLRHFTVRNRPDIFVCMRDDSVVYCKLKEETVYYMDGSEYYGDDMQQMVRSTSPHSSLIASGIADQMAFSHHSRTQSAQPTTNSQPLQESMGPITTSNSSRRTSPRSSPGGKVHSTNSIQLSPEPRKPARTSESRELVLEVYGVDLPNWISDELVDMLENRLTSHITLKEVQQFLLRNPGSKLSRADIDFILPADKPPALRETLDLPSEINDTAQFSRLLRESVLTNSIRILTGNGLATALKNYRLRQQYNNMSFVRGYSMQKDFAIDNPNVDELCFYYSCINRTPGVCSELELSIGQGVAGFVISFNDVPLENGSPNGLQDFAQRSLLSSFASKPSTHLSLPQQSRVTLSIDIWTVGQLDPKSLYEHIYKSFRQSICDYMIEHSISTTLLTPTATTVDIISDRSLTTLHTSLVNVLDGAFQWNNPSVTMVSQPLQLQPWCLNEVVQQLNADFLDLNANIKSVIGIQDRNDGGYHGCCTSSELKRRSEAMMQPQRNFRYSIISGLQEFFGTKHFVDPHHKIETIADDVRFPHSIRTDQTSMHSRHESVASSNITGNTRNTTKPPVKAGFHGYYKDAAHRRAFHLLVLDAESITLYTYNYTKSFVDQLLQTVMQTITHQNSRVRMLQNIMHQKLGLFRHSETFAAIFTDVNAPAENDSSLGVEALKNLVVDTYSNEEVRPPIISRGSKSSVSSSKWLADCNSTLKDAYTNPPDYTETVDQHVDYLIRHGTPFLDTYLRHSQLRSAHDKAFNVYVKWASRYAVPDRKDYASEMMSVTELRLILKASRLLHFCRTPLVFSDIDTKRSSVFGSIETIQKHQRMEETMIWYEGVARTFMGEYASYLESIGMHVIVHGVSGNNSNSKEDHGVYLSFYKVTEDFLVQSPVIYLLQVFPGGTIMCEIRLTDVFVSVTLYTLHRRYGRLKMTQSSYMHDSIEKRRADFKDFTEECDRIKQKIQVNSFVHDFNLKFIQQSLDTASSLPFSVDLLDIIKNTYSLYNKPATYSRNRIFCGFYELALYDEEENMANLLPMVIRNASKYGFESLSSNGVPRACFVSSDDASFVKGSGSRTRSNYRYTLLITDDFHGRDLSEFLAGGTYHYAESPITEVATTPTTTTDSKVTVQYFVIVTYWDQNSYKTWHHSPRYKPRSMSGTLKEILEPEKYTLEDVTQKARQRIDDLMKQAVFLYHQDVMWNQLYQAIGKKEKIDNVQELIDLSGQFYALDAVSTEASLQRFLELNLSWEAVLNSIHRFYPNTSKILELHSSRHLLLFNPSAVQEYFVHIVVDSSKSVQISAKSKQPRPNTYSLDPTEQVFVGNLAVTFGYCLWKYTN
ncbi:hypothetical protein BJV82DRAFT_611484 [Fennellomyces sp. T-0311]|nr:hypothetical protein BJV82DRAFT_611484 [Fennellomyces sp. T-0311]